MKHLLHGFAVVVSCAACLRDPPPVAQRRVASTPTPTPTPTPPAVAPAVLNETPVRVVVRVTGGANEHDRLPLVVAIHGLGDTPERFVEFVTSMHLRVRVAAPAGLDRWGDGYSWFPVRVGTERAHWVAGMRRAADALVPVLRRLATAHLTCGAPIVTGFSQGGMLTYALTARSDALVGAALPIGGLLPQELWPQTRALGGLLPQVWAFHGASDERVPISDDRATNQAFRSVGFSADLREYAGVGHTISPSMARDVEARIAEITRNFGCSARGAP